VLGNIAGRGVMYAVCVAPDNETHRSLTVNVLQGEQQEHRNMPLDEAMSFVGKSFSRFIEKPTAGGGVSQLGFATGAAASGGIDQLPAFGHPNDIRTILGFLIDDRPMSIMEYDKLIKYLATRREGTLKAEYGANIPAHLLLPPVGPMQDPILKVFSPKRVLSVFRLFKNCPLFSRYSDQREFCPRSVYSKIAVFPQTGTVIITIQGSAGHSHTGNTVPSARRGFCTVPQQRNSSTVQVQ
jgi:hypothetical protein